MAEEEQYDIVPHKRLRELEKELELLKKNPLGGTAEGQNMMNAMDRLSANIEELTSLFKHAVEEMRVEEKDSEVFSKKMEPMMERFDTLIDQNHKIAKGILAVADMIKEQVERPKPTPPQPAMPPPGYGYPPPRVRIQPRPFTPPPGPNPFDEFSPGPPQEPSMPSERTPEERRIPTAPPPPAFLKKEV